MAELTVPTLDFSTIGNLGQVYKQAQADQVRQQTLAQLGQGGTIDPQALVKAGIGINDLGLANLGVGMQNHNDTLAHQTVEDRRASANDTFSHDIQTKQLAISQQNSDRQNEGVPEKAADRAKAAATYGITPDMPAFRTFVLTGALPADNTPAGFTKQADGSVAPMPGGPADPTYLGNKAGAIAKAEADVPGGGGYSTQPIYAKDSSGNPVLIQAGKNGTAVQTKLPDGVTLSGTSPETVSSLALRYRKGETSVANGPQFRGPQGRVAYNALMDEVQKQDTAEGTAPTDITQNEITLQGDKARERASGTMEGRMAPASIEAQGAFKIAQNSLDNLWRTNNVPLNRLLQMGEAAESDPNLKAAKVATNTAVMTYSRAIAPTGVGTVDAQAHAREILDTADGPAATAAAFAQLAREVDMAHASPGLARQYFAASRKASVEGKPAPEMPQYQPAAPKVTAPPPEAVAALKNDPRRAADFDAYYGAGSARAALSGNR